jgi:RNA recognition motif-containing protein
VTFTEQDAADRCLQNGLFFYGRPARVNYQDQNTARSNRDASTRSNPPSSALFLGTLPLGIVESDLRAHFTSFGPLASVRIGTHPTGEPRGFAHVQFEREEDAIACFEKYAAEPLWILDQSVRVDYAAARKTSRTTNPPTQKLYFYKFTGDEAALRKILGELEASVQKVHFRTYLLLASLLFAKDAQSPIE